MNFTYVIFDFVEVGKLEINSLLPYSADPIRRSVANEEKCYVKYKGEMPDCVKNLTSKSQEYNSTEIQEFLKNENWNTLIPF